MTVKLNAKKVEALKFFPNIFTISGHRVFFVNAEAWVIEAHGWRAGYFNATCVDANSKYVGITMTNCVSEEAAVAAASAYAI